MPKFSTRKQAAKEPELLKNVNDQKCILATDCMGAIWAQNCMLADQVAMVNAQKCNQATDAKGVIRAQNNNKFSSLITLMTPHHKEKQA